MSRWPRPSVNPPVSLLPVASSTAAMHPSVAVSASPPIGTKAATSTHAIFVTATRPAPDGFDDDIVEGTVTTIVEEKLGADVNPAGVDGPVTKSVVTEWATLSLGETEELEDELDDAEDNESDEDDTGEDEDVASDAEDALPDDELDELTPEDEALEEEALLLEPLALLESGLGTELELALGVDIAEEEPEANDEKDDDDDNETEGDVVEPAAQ
ncbi:hypothetical protein B0H21DRAFT_824431 [Amylocystis lapponica]|nr:hypothetical protein B0H21DRAFT_824431 [Amylocystis lapponica]